MNADLFTRWLKAEAEILHHQDSTPEAFIKRAKPMIDALANAKTIEVMSELELMECLTSASSRTNSKPAPQNTHFDIVDLCLYRAN